MRSLWASLIDEVGIPTIHGGVVHFILMSVGVLSCSAAYMLGPRTGRRGFPRGGGR